MGGGGLPRTGRRVEDATTCLLRAHPSSVAAARRVVRGVLTATRREELIETAQLLISEVVTNALVHAGTPIGIRASVGADGLRVEVTDGSTQAPAPRSYGPMAGTGRGLRLLQQLADQWGTLVRLDGKTVWFELDSGNRLDEIASSPTPDAGDVGVTLGSSGEDIVDVVLLNLPLLLHAAWQEHAEGMLREHLLVSLEADDPTGALEAHAAASDALSLLHEHIPEPHLGENPEELMAHAVEPGVSSQLQVLPIPRTSVPHFRGLDQALDSALALADSGAFLTPPIQPELRELRRWLCREVSRQVNGQRPTAWLSDPDAEPTAVLPPIWWKDEVASSNGQALIAADDTDRIVGVSWQACELLGYEEPGQLLGRRLVAIIPARFHQAHLAGFTLHLSNGRSPLLGRAVVVPVLRGDGTETTVELLVESRRQPAGRHLFVARMRPARL